MGHELGSLESLREHNRGRVVDALRRRGTASRAELARLTGLSRTTVSTLVGELQAQGVVTERAGRSDRTAQGRPGILLALDGSVGVVAGIHFGHAAITVAVGDLSQTVLAERRRALDVDHVGRGALDAAAELLGQALDEAAIDSGRVLAIGAAVAGPVDQGRDVVHAGTVLPSWEDLAPATELGTRFGVPVHVDNDANLGALAELHHGAGAGVRDLLYVYAGAGIGAGLVIGGRLHRGAGGTAGELGHVLVDEGGAFCRCGSRGCLETVAAGPAIVTALRPTHGAELTLERVIALAVAGDPAPRRAIADAGTAIGRALADLCDVLNPAVVLVGGDLAAAGDLLLEPVRDAIVRDAMAPTAAVLTVGAGALSGRAEVLGALVLASERAELPTIQPMPSVP